MEDNPYIVHLAPDEFHELLSEYENYYEWCFKKLDTRQQALADRVLAKLRQADATHVCIDEGVQSTQAKLAKQFTRDDVACISACTVNAVLEKLSIKQSVAGIAVLPLGQDVWMVDIVMQDNVEQDTWATQLTLPLLKEDVDAYLSRIL